MSLSREGQYTQDLSFKLKSGRWDGPPLAMEEGTSAKAPKSAIYK